MEPGATGRPTKFADISEREHLIAMDECLAALQCCKNRKSPGTNGLNSVVCASLAELSFINLCWTRPRGRPRKRWEDGVAEDARDMGISNWRRVAMDRVDLSLIHI